MEEGQKNPRMVAVAKKILESPITVSSEDASVQIAVREPKTDLQQLFDAGLQVSKRRRSKHADDLKEKIAPLSSEKCGHKKGKTSKSTTDDSVVPPDDKDSTLVTCAVTKKLERNRNRTNKTGKKNTEQHLQHLPTEDADLIPQRKAKMQKKSMPKKTQSQFTSDEVESNLKNDSDLRTGSGKKLKSNSIDDEADSDINNRSASLEMPQSTVMPQRTVTRSGSKKSDNDKQASATKKGEREPIPSRKSPRIKQLNEPVDDCELR